MSKEQQSPRYNYDAKKGQIYQYGKMIFSNRTKNMATLLILSFSSLRYHLSYLLLLPFLPLPFLTHLLTYSLKGFSMFACVVLPVPLDRSFHYLIPEALAGKVVPGARVEVPFGPRHMCGVVASLDEEAPVARCKPVIRVIDPGPVVTKELMALARWLSERCVCSLGEALGTIVPSSLRPPVRASAAGTSGPCRVPPDTPPVLTSAQKAVVGSLKEAVADGKFAPFLLHGVTGSGKTEVYLHVMEDVIARGRSVVFLLPEISLTPQFIGIVRRRFPGVVGVWHSNLAAGERYRTWEAARTGRIRIMLGARSAVFAPFERPGLIIIDEEHEPTYKQEQKPSYHARETALQRGRLSGAVVIMGSATPSLETYYNAVEGTYRLLELKERIDNRRLPPVTLIDAGRLPRRSRVISGQVAEALTRVLARREQAILFLNRRGFSPGVTCQDCGQVWQCPHCSISMVYHREPEGLQCHYCDYRIPWPGKCPGCGKDRIALFGIGTEKVETELKRLFPHGRVFRLDRDTASRKGVYQQAYDGFRNEEFDILLGTQMVTKGFDFPRVTMVGVIDADTSLYLPDFRSAERTFQLITQVAGRSGRGTLGGEVIVQSRHPDHYALLAARAHDYRDFYRQEMAFRRELRYPPVCHLLNVLIRGRNEERAGEAAKTLGAALRSIVPAACERVDVLGPVQASRYKLRGYFRWQALLKGTEKDLLSIAHALKKTAFPSGAVLSIDMDPQDTL